MGGIIKIKDLKEGAFVGIVVGVIASKDDVREVATKFNPNSKVCNCKVKDDSGEISYTLWGKSTATPVGDAITVEDGFVDNWNDELQLKKGKKKV